MSLIKRGISAALASSGKAGKFLTLQPDVPVDIVLAHGLDGVQTVDQHDWWDYTPAPHLVCIGEGCPSCALGNEAKAKSYIGVITKEQEVKFFPAGAQILNQLQKYEKAVGDITGRVVRLEKTGAGLKTKYSALPLGKKMDVSKFVLPDLEELLGALTFEDQVVVLKEAGIDVAGLRGPSAKKAGGKKASPKSESTPAPVEAEETKVPWDTEETTEELDGWAAL